MHDDTESKTLKFYNRHGVCLAEVPIGDEDHNAEFSDALAPESWTCVIVIPYADASCESKKHPRFTQREIPRVGVYTGFWYYYRKKHKPPDDSRTFIDASFRYSPTEAESPALTAISNPLLTHIAVTDALTHRCLCHACVRLDPRRDAPDFYPKYPHFGFSTIPPNVSVAYQTALTAFNETLRRIQISIQQEVRLLPCRFSRHHHQKNNRLKTIKGKDDDKCLYIHQ